MPQDEELKKLRRLIEEKAREYDPTLKVKITTLAVVDPADYYDCEKDLVEVVVPTTPPDKEAVLSYLARGIGAREVAKDFGCEFYGTSTIRFGSPIVRKDVKKAMNRAAVASVYGVKAACRFNVIEEYVNLVQKDVGDFVMFHTEEEAKVALVQFREVSEALQTAIIACER